MTSEEINSFYFYEVSFALFLGWNQRRVREKALMNNGASFVVLNERFYAMDSENDRQTESVNKSTLS